MRIKDEKYINSSIFGMANLPTPFSQIALIIWATADKQKINEQKENYW